MAVIAHRLRERAASMTTAGSPSLTLRALLGATHEP